MKSKILITGGSGLVGTELTQLLQHEGYQVAILSRSTRKSEIPSFYWDYESNILDEKALEFADLVVHLAGENLSSKPWSAKQKKKILDSRVKTTNLLFEKIKTSKNPPHTFVSASAIGYYGTYNSDKIFVETDEPGKDFLAETVLAWEQSVLNIKSLGLRTPIARIGVVFSEKGGALPKMLKPIRWGLGSAIGNGQQYLPWIALPDLARVFQFIIENRTLNGIYNAVAPEHINQKKLTQKLSKIFKKPFFLPPVPAFVFKLMFGEMAVILLKGSRVSSEKIQNEGFEFQYKSIEDLF